MAALWIKSNAHGFAKVTAGTDASDLAGEKSERGKKETWGTNGSCPAPFGR
jgi:hypothetical protein